MSDLTNRAMKKLITLTLLVLLLNAIMVSTNVTLPKVSPHDLIAKVVDFGGEIKESYQSYVNDPVNSEIQASVPLECIPGEEKFFRAINGIIAKVGSATAFFGGMVSE